MLPSSAFCECITGSILITQRQGGIMPKFNVVLKEKSIRYATVEVDAADWEDAEKLAMNQYYDNKIIFEYDGDIVEIDEVEEIEL